MGRPLGMAEDPAPSFDLPSDIAFRFFLTGLDPVAVIKEHARGLRHPERAYYESVAKRLAKKNAPPSRYQALH